MRRLHFTAFLKHTLNVTVTHFNMSNKENSFIVLNGCTAVKIMTVFFPEVWLDVTTFSQKITTDIFKINMWSEDGRCMFLQMVGNLLQKYKIPRIQFYKKENLHSILFGFSLNEHYITNMCQTFLCLCPYTVV